MELDIERNRIDHCCHEYIGKQAVDILKELSGSETVSLPKPHFIVQATGEGVLWLAGEVIDALALDTKQACAALREMDDCERLKS